MYVGVEQLAGWVLFKKQRGLRGPLVGFFQFNRSDKNWCPSQVSCVCCNYKELRQFSRGKIKQNPVGLRVWEMFDPELKSDSESDSDHWRQFKWKRVNLDQLLNPWHGFYTWTCSYTTYNFNNVFKTELGCRCFHLLIDKRVLSRKVTPWSLTETFKQKLHLTVKHGDGGIKLWYCCTVHMGKQFFSFTWNQQPGCWNLDTGSCWTPDLVSDLINQASAPTTTLMKICELC